MRPDWLKTKIFLDSGDPEETRIILDLMGFLDGQTTNPTLVVKNPEVQKIIKQGFPINPILILPVVTGENLIFLIP